MFNEMKEPFYDKTKVSDPPKAHGSQKMGEIQQYFGDILPNLVYTNDKKLNINTITRTTSTRLQDTLPLFNKRHTNNENARDNTAQLAAAQAACESLGGGSQLEHITSLAKHEDKKSRLRCGWVYDTNNPQNGRGAYGTVEGPFQTTATGKWMWNLDEAKQKYHKYYCSQVQGCQDIDAAKFKGICGWNQKSGKAVPIVNGPNGGEVAYPNDPLAACSDAALVTSGSKCVIQPKRSGPNGVRLPADVCFPRSDGSLHRDCLIQKAKSAGCSDQGTLVLGLNNGSDSDYLDALATTKAYEIYQKGAVIPINDKAVASGRITATEALNDFSKINEQASSKMNGSLQFAARDLCFKQGTLDTFDFCTEIQENTIGPFALNCLQKAFLNGGGTTDGKIYPTASTLSYWNAFHTWGEVLNNINTLKSNMDSTDYTTQADATWKMMGIAIKPPPPPPPPCTANLPKTVIPVRGQIIGTIDFAANFRLAFDLTPKGIVNDWGCILHFTATGANCCENGDRQPGIWFHPGQIGAMVFVVGNINLDMQGGINTMNKKSRIEVICKNDMMTVKVNDTMTKAYIKPRMNSRVTVYSGDPWYDAANAVIENLCFTDLDAYDYNKVYKQGEYVNQNSRPYSLKQYVGLAGYAPDRPGDQLWQPNTTPAAYQGCYRDKGDRALPTRLANVTSVQQCYDQAKSGNYNTFGLQYGGECWVGNNTDWGRYGKADGDCGALGGSWTQQVYTRLS